jgi:hypothetical protein
MSYDIKHIFTFYAPAIKWQVLPGSIISFPSLSLPTVAHIQLKFDTWIHGRNTQIKYEFDRGPMIFERVISNSGHNKIQTPKYPFS